VKIKRGTASKKRTVPFLIPCFAAVFVVFRIICHLKLTFEAERPPPPRCVQQELLMAAGEKGEYF
jgi:hypothetical protein